MPVGSYQAADGHLFASPPLWACASALVWSLISQRFAASWLHNVAGIVGVRPYIRQRGTG